MNKKKINKKATSDVISTSIVYIPSITSHSSLPYASEVVFLGKIYK